jgi:hypothetical protein
MSVVEGGRMRLIIHRSYVSMRPCSDSWVWGRPRLVIEQEIGGD